MTTRCHIPLLKYCSTIVFILVHHPGLVSRLKPGMKLVRTVNFLLSFYPLNSYIFIQIFFFKVIQFVGGTTHLVFAKEN